MPRMTGSVPGAMRPCLRASLWAPSISVVRLFKKMRKPNSSGVKPGSSFKIRSNCASSSFSNLSKYSAQLGESWWFLIGTPYAVVRASIMALASDSGSSLGSAGAGLAASSSFGTAISFCISFCSSGDSVLYKASAIASLSPSVTSDTSLPDLMATFLSVNISFASARLNTPIRWALASSSFTEPSSFI